jgi:hypothetical protein
LVPNRLVGQRILVLSPGTLVLSADGRIVISTPGPAGAVVAGHRLVGPGATSLVDADYGQADPRAAAGGARTERWGEGLSVRG